MQNICINIFYIIINHIIGNTLPPSSAELILNHFIMLKLEDFKIKEIETLDSIKGGGDCLYTTHETVNFLGWIIETGTKGDISPD